MRPVPSCPGEGGAAGGPRQRAGLEGGAEGGAGSVKGVFVQDSVGRRGGERDLSQAGPEGWGSGTLLLCHSLVVLERSG